MRVGERAECCSPRHLSPQSEPRALRTKATSVDQATIRGVVERLKVRGLIDLSKDKTDAAR